MGFIILVKMTILGAHSACIIMLILFKAILITYGHISMYDNGLCKLVQRYKILTDFRRIVKLIIS